MLVNIIYLKLDYKLYRAAIISDYLGRLYFQTLFSGDIFEGGGAHTYQLMPVKSLDVAKNSLDIGSFPRRHF